MGTCTSIYLSNESMPACLPCHLSVLPSIFSLRQWKTPQRYYLAPEVDNEKPISFESRRIQVQSAASASSGIATGGQHALQALQSQCSASCNWPLLLAIGAILSSKMQCAGDAVQFNVLCALHWVFQWQSKSQPEISKLLNFPLDRPSGQLYTYLFCWHISEHDREWEIRSGVYSCCQDPLSSACPLNSPSQNSPNPPSWHLLPTDTDAISVNHWPCVQCTVYDSAESLLQKYLE